MTFDNDNSYVIAYFEGISGIECIPGAIRYNVSPSGEMG